jgi:hypothetical protein
MDRLSRFGSLAKMRTLAIAAAVLGAAAAPALADGPPAMPAIVFPIDVTSVVTAVATAGGVILLAYFGIKIGFALAKKLGSRLTKST